jgi:hypothetical protein
MKSRQFGKKKIVTQIAELNNAVTIRPLKR